MEGKYPTVGGKYCPCKIISFFIFLLLEIEGFLLLEIGADFSYWKLMRARARARLTSNQERSVVLLRVQVHLRFGGPWNSVKML